MNHRRIVLLLAALGALLLVLWKQHEAGWIWLVGGVDVLDGAAFARVLATVFLAAVACTYFPERRVAILVVAGIGQLLAVHPAHQVVLALVVWLSFYAVVKASFRWILKGPALAALFAVPVVLFGTRPEWWVSRAYLLAFADPNFTLRAVLFAYEATKKRALLKGCGWKEYLCYLIPPPIGTVKVEPIGFVAMHTGLTRIADPSLMRQGLLQVLLGVVLLQLRVLGRRADLLPDWPVATELAADLNAFGAIALAHLLLLSFYLSVAGHIHFVVGLLRFCGFDIAPGMDRPYLSRNVLDYWRRWNTYYRDFLMTLAYYPAVMALKRRPYVAVAVGGALVFLLTGVTHAAQYFVRRPEELTASRFLQAQAWSVVYGALVVAWMLREAVQVRRRGRRPAAKGTVENGPLAGARRALGVAVSLTVIAVVLVLLHAPLSGAPLSSVSGFYAALLRIPGISE